MCTLYYRISEDGYPIVFTERIEEGLIEYVEGKEPTELKMAIELNLKKDKENTVRAKRDSILKELDKPLWILSLSKKEKEELNIFYRELLDATEKMTIPEIPEFVRKILQKEK